MSHLLSSLRTALHLLPRAAAIVAALAAPVVAMPASGRGEGTILEAPPPAKSGAGLVLLVSLQRH